MGSGGGPASISFTPRQEAANGEGVLVKEGATLFAGVSAREIVEKLYNAAPGSLAGLLGKTGFTETSARTTLERHDTHTLAVDFVDDYDIGLDLLPTGGPQLFGNTTIGTDEFKGDLILQEDGSWKGVVTGVSTAESHTAAFGEPCDTSWAGTQQIEIHGTIGSYDEGNFRMIFTPVSPPAYTKPPTCPEVLPLGQSKTNYLAYLDSDIESEFGWDVTLPDKPAGTWTKTWPTDAPVGSHYKRTTSLTVEYHEPPS